MTITLIPRRWNQQPQQPVQARTIFGKQIGTTLLAGAGTAINGGQITRVGGITVAPRRIGKAFIGDTTNNGAYAKLRRPWSTAAADAVPMSLVVVFRAQGADATSAAIGTLGSSSGSPGNTLCGLFSTDTVTDTVSFYVQDEFGDLLYNITSSTIDISDNKWHCAVATWSCASGGSMQLYIDGLTDGTQNKLTAGGVLDVIYNYVAACCAVRGNAAEQFSGFDLALVAPIYGKLSAFEGRSLSFNPWQLFDAPPLRVGWALPEAGDTLMGQACL
jgi:hypothetical protein